MTQTGFEGEKGAAMAQVVAMAVISATVMYAVIGCIFVKIMSGAPAPSLPAAARVAFIGIGFAAALLSFIVRKTMEGNTPDAKLPDKLRIALISLAVAEVPGVLGLLYALLTHTLALPIVLWACALVASVMLFPRKAWLLGE